KRTSELIPLCHPLSLSYVGVEGAIDVEAGEIELIAEARTTGPTGVEMEALTAASVAALTVYDMVKGVERGAEIAGEAEDLSGAALAEHAQAAGAEIVTRDVLPDDRAAIEAWLRRQAADGASLIFTTGGTGLTDDDVTPEATEAVIERAAPGFAEAMRAEAVCHTPMGILTRGVSGIVGRSLIINFPGNPKAIG